MDTATIEDLTPRRDFLTLSTIAVGTVGVAVAAWPFIDSMNPSADVLAVSTVELDLSPIERGQRITLVWRGNPVFVAHRTAREIDLARADDNAELPDPATDAARVINAEWLIVIGVCTHLGCIPLGQRAGDLKGEWKGWFCPCHGSHYDTAGRIRKGPAPRNLDVPPYKFVGDNLVRIGERG